MSARPGVQTWRRAFAIEARHTYFSDGRCSNVTFEPTEESRARLANLGLICREAAGSVTVIRATDAPDATGTAPLVFRMVTTDRAFGSYTRLDGADAASTLLFSSNHALAADDDGTRRLHTGAYVSAADRVRLDDAELQGLAGDRDRAAPPLGFVSIALPPAATADGDTWVIAFDARNTLWKYFVLGTSETAPTIRDADGTIEFEPAAATVLPGNRRAVILRSKVAIPLRERPAQRFQLRVATPVGERVLVRRLALGSPHRLGKDTVDGREVTVSEIYVNL